jgi:predicted alpha/beta-hydrolase family hydrolase
MRVLDCVGPAILSVKRLSGSPASRSSDLAQWRVAVEGEETSAVFEPALGADSKAVFVCAHGAGTDMNHRSMLQLAPVLRDRGLDLVRFNFLYREKGSGRSDPMPRLKACIEAVVARTRKELTITRLIIGGRSMGGRAASMLAAEGFACDGLLLLAYPLHPAGQPEKLRDAHLAQIKVPVLCINGTRDALCRRDLMERAIENLAWQMHWLEGQGHSFAVDDAVGEVVEGWLKRSVR